MERARRFRPSGRMRAAAYGLLWSCANLLQTAANGCLWLAAGILRRADLRAASDARWHRFGTSIDEIDAGLDVSERQLYGELLDVSDRVLLVGCGTGRDLLALGRLGYDVTGLEQVPELVEIARNHLARRSVTLALESGAIESVSLPGRFDVVVFSLGVYSFLAHSRARVSTLARIRALLSDRGRVVISYYEQAHHSPWALRLAALGARLSATDWHPEQGDVFSRDYLAPHVLRYEHLFSPDEVARECEAAGLRVSREGAMNRGIRYALAIPIAPAALS